MDVTTVTDSISRKNYACFMTIILFCLQALNYSDFSLCIVKEMLIAAPLASIKFIH